MTYSHSPNGLLPSALKSLTAEFEMGSGVTSSVEPPELYCPHGFDKKYRFLNKHQLVDWS